MLRLNGIKSLTVEASSNVLQAFGSDGAVRPGLIDWNPISRTHALEQMLEEIGEPVYRWKRKEVVE